jgi:tripeptide aminopeptidase
VETRIDRGYRGYRFRKDEPVVALAAQALERCGFTPSYARTGGGADANVFNERGIPCVVLANGMAEIHTPGEHIAVADIEAMVDVSLALLDGAHA